MFEYDDYNYLIAIDPYFIVLNLYSKRKSMGIP